MKVERDHVRRRQAPEEMGYETAVWKVNMMKTYYTHI